MWKKESIEVLESKGSRRNKIVYSKLLDFHGGGKSILVRPVMHKTKLISNFRMD